MISLGLELNWHDTQEKFTLAFCGVILVILFVKVFL